MTLHRLPSRTAVALIARREFLTRVRSKIFLVSIGVSVMLIVVGFAASALLGDDDPTVVAIVDAGGRTDALELAAVETGRLSGVTVETARFDGRTDAQLALDAGDVDVIVDGRTVVVERAGDQSELGAAIVRQFGLVEGLVTAGLAPDEIASLAADSQPLIVETDPPLGGDDAGAVPFASVILLFLAVQTAGGFIMMGVIEEKSSKVVELVLSSIRARDLLVGKIVGIGGVGLINAVLIASAAVIAAVVSGTELPASTGRVIAWSLVWFLFGFVLYASIFAAGASLAPSAEDAQAALAPVSVVLMLSYFASIVVASEPDSTLARVLSLVPTISPFAIPGRIGASSISAVEIAAALVLTAAATVGVVLFAERVYVRALLATDKISFREALRRQGA